MNNCFTDDLKLEKANAMAKYRRFQLLKKLFCFVEVCLALIFFSSISSHLPFILKISSDYLRQLLSLFLSPIFVFLLGNSIIVTLLLKSGQFASSNDAETELYNDFICHTQNLLNFGLEISPQNGSESEMIVFQDKQIIYEVKDSHSVPVPLSVSDTDSDSKVFVRSQSEKLKREKSEETGTKLRRSETEMRRKTKSVGHDELYYEDGLSSEEFRRTIEAFIAKQIQFHKEESMAIVLR